MSEQKSRLVTQKKAAELTGKTLNAINHLVRRQRLRVRRKDDKTYVFLSDVLNYKPDKPGRKKRTE